MNNSLRHTPCLHDAELDQLMLGEMTDIQLRIAESHLESCAECVRKLEGRDVSDRFLTELREASTRSSVLDMPEESVARLMERLSAIDRSTHLSAVPSDDNDADADPKESPAMSARRFVAALMTSGLIKDSDARPIGDSVAHGESGRSLAEQLVDDGRLTRFQAETLLAGDKTPLVLGDYVLIDRIGGGGMGRVFKAVHRHMKRIVAIKMLAPKLADDPEAIGRFRREVEAAAALSHPNIVAAYDAGFDRGVWFLVMEYVEGSDLAKLVKRDGVLSVNEALGHTRQAARGLAYAHGKGVLHRDIKPSNLILAKDGSVKVLDMGLARFADLAPRSNGNLTQSGQVMGTVDYMAPEQSDGNGEIDARADVYGLGCTLHFLLTGRSVYAGETIVQRVMAHHKQDVPSLSVIRPDASEELDRLFSKMIAKRPEDRFQSMAEVEAAIARIAPAHVDTPITNEPVTATQDLSTRVAEKAISKPSRIGPSRWPLIAVAFWGGLLMLAGIVFFTKSRDVKVTANLADIDLSDASLSFRLDGVAVSPANLGKEMELRPGEHVLEVARGTEIVKRKLITVTGGRQIGIETRDITPRTEPSIAPASKPDHRALAEWVIDTGGEVRVTDDSSKVDGDNFNKITPFRQGEELPKGGFSVVDISFIEKELSDVEFDRFRTVESLLSVQMQANHRLTHEGLSAFLASRRLAKLDLYNCSHIDDFAAEGISSFANLIELNLEGTKFTDKGIGKLTSLKNLRMLQCGPDVAGTTLPNLKSLPQLHRLHIVGDAFTNEAAAKLVELRGIDTLTLSNCNGLDDDALASIAAMERLTTLRVTSDKFTDLGLAHLRRRKALKEFRITSPRVTDKGVVELADLWRLNHLDINRAEVTGENLAIVLERLVDLKVLALNDCPVTDGGVEAISTSPGIETLLLESTRITDRSIPHLAKLKRLRSLRINKTRVTADGVRRLRESLPKCEIEAENLIETPPDPTTGTRAGERREFAGIPFRWCPPGEYMMGEGGTAEKVTLTRGFWLSETEVTQGQWQAVMETRPWKDEPSAKEGVDYAASCISCESAFAFCDRITNREREAGRLPDGWMYRLPTHAQWEYACRAGTDTAYGFGDDEAMLNEHAWWGANDGKGNAAAESFMHKVAQKKPNSWGFHDMHGNAWETCADWWGPKPPGGVDPVVRGPSGIFRIVRGGCWKDGAIHVRSANFGRFVTKEANPVLGLRVALVPDAK